jgi:hypothetical protein
MKSVSYYRATYPESRPTSSSYKQIGKPKTSLARSEAETGMGEMDD